jgi:hypothetical protein
MILSFDLVTRYKVKANLSLCLVRLQTVKTYVLSGGATSRILYLGTSQRWMIILTPRPLYPRSGRRPWCIYTLFYLCSFPGPNVFVVSAMVDLFRLSPTQLILSAESGEECLSSMSSPLWFSSTVQRCIPKRSYLKLTCISHSVWRERGLYFYDNYLTK